MLEENLLNAAKYVYNAINCIKNFEEFNEYKIEINKALEDIILLTKEIVKIKNEQKMNTSLDIKDQKVINSTELNITSINNDNENIKETNKNESNSPINLYKKIDKIEIPKEIDSSSVKKRNYSEKKELKKVTNKTININNTENNNLPLSASIEKTRKTISNKSKTPHKKNIPLPKKKHKKPPPPHIPEVIKQKNSKIKEIILKINSDDYINHIIRNLFGENIYEKLVASSISDEVINSLMESIRKIEKLKQKDEKNRLKLKSENEYFYNDKDLFKNEYNFVKKNIRKEGTLSSHRKFYFWEINQNNHKERFNNSYSNNSRSNTYNNSFRKFFYDSFRKGEKEKLPLNHFQVIRNNSCFRTTKTEKNLILNVDEGKT